MRAWALGVVFAASCGRLGFTPTAGDAPAALPIVVQSAAVVPPAPVPTTTLPVTATRAGDLLVVATADITGAAPLQSIGDDAGNRYVSAQAGYAIGTTVAGEVWYVATAAAGATTLQITDGSATQREVWFVEVAGASALEAADTVSDGSDDGSPVGPSVSPSRLPAVVVTVIDVAGTTTGVGSGFTPLANLHGDQAAFALASAPGTYAPTWTTNVPGVYCGATVAFAAP